MDEIPIPGRDEASRLLGEVAARFGAPAFVRRARQVEDAFDHLVHRCQKQREEWLDQVRIPWHALLAITDQFDQKNELAGVLGDSADGSRIPASGRRLRNALWQLRDSIERFNCRWQKFIDELNLVEINQQREDYNRYYVLEKECALRSARLARRGFIPLAPITPKDLLALLPLLPVPEPVHV
jgi:hypothetical protein